MGLETGTFISDLVITNPLGTDDRSTADDHLRLIKKVLENTLVNFNAAVNATPTELNLLVGLLATSSELNILDGATVTTAEINRLNNIAGNGDLDAFPTGTLALFQQTAAPTGWTKQTTHNNKALRLVSGTAASAGTSPFTTVFGLQATATHTLTVAQTPAHTHGNSGSHEHSYIHGTSGGSSTGPGGPTTAQGGDTTTGGGNHTHTSVGSGSSHSHNIELRVLYVDVIIASKV